MVAVQDPNMLGSMLLFDGLTPEQLSTINGLLRRRTVPARKSLMLIEDAGEAAYLILSGTVKIYLDQADGTELTLALLGPGEIVGEMSLVERRGRSASVVTQEDCTLLVLDRQMFERCLQTMPVMAINLVRLLARRLRLANAQIQAMGTLDVYGRVARQILAFADEYGESRGDGKILIPLRFTQSDMASFVGASRVRVNQVMVAYKRSRYITVDDAYRITVHNAAALTARCQV
jgi:CRP/FNR family transcriptional regulator, cyclic AMP receptor protein